MSRGGRGRQKGTAAASGRGSSPCCFSGGWLDDAFSVVHVAGVGVGLFPGDGRSGAPTHWQKVAVGPRRGLGNRGSGCRESRIPPSCGRPDRHRPRRGPPSLRLCASVSGCIVLFRLAQLSLAGTAGRSGPPSGDSKRQTWRRRRPRRIPASLKEPAMIATASRPSRSREYHAGKTLPFLSSVLTVGNT